jgi:hypothetical protein
VYLAAPEPFNNSIADKLGTIGVTTLFEIAIKCEQKIALAWQRQQLLAWRALV